MPITIELTPSQVEEIISHIAVSLKVQSTVFRNHTHGASVAGRVATYARSKNEGYQISFLEIKKALKLKKTAHGSIYYILKKLVKAGELQKLGKATWQVL